MNPSQVNNGGYSSLQLHIPAMSDCVKPNSYTFIVGPRHTGKTRICEKLYRDFVIQNGPITTYVAKSHSDVQSLFRILNNCDKPVFLVLRNVAKYIPDEWIYNNTNITMIIEEQTLMSLRTTHRSNMDLIVICRILCPSELRRITSYYGDKVSTAVEHLPLYTGLIIDPTTVQCYWINGLDEEVPINGEVIQSVVKTECDTEKELTSIIDQLVALRRKIREQVQK